MFDYEEEDLQEAPAPAETPTYNLSDEQKGILSAIKGGDNLLITGVAGTGKSFLVERILEENPDAALTATTGLAALNIGGSTIHSWAGVGIGEDHPREIAEKILYNHFKEEVRNRILTTKTLIVDEVSMLNGKIMRTLDQVLRRVRAMDDDYGMRELAAMPFGGMQVVFTGDFLQLPPVIKDEQEKRRMPFCFKSPSWKRGHIHTHLLTKVFRQSQQEFVDALFNIRIGRPRQQDIDLMRSREGQMPINGINPLRLYTTNDRANTVNQNNLRMIDKPVHQFDAIDEVVLSQKDKRYTNWFVENHLRSISQHCIAQKELFLKVGAQVMLIKNLDVKKKMVNGSMGKVIDFKTLTQWGGVDVWDDTVKKYVKQYGDVPYPVVEFYDTGVVQIIQPDVWESKDGKTVVATRKQLPIRLAWAITVHKSQGMSLDHVLVDLQNTFECGQVYVALSRARSLDGLYLYGFNPDKIKAHPIAVKFYEELLEKEVVHV